jgi:hypothetical protein
MDTAARVVHLVVMPGDRVGNFIVKYQDRIVYATDLGFSKEASPAEVIKEWEEQHGKDWRYFATRDKFEYEGHQTQGLGLPPDLLRKLYHANAVHWFPGIIASGEAATHPLRVRTYGRKYELYAALAERDSDRPCDAGPVS